MAILTLVLATLSCLLTPITATGESLNEVLFNGDYEFIDLTHKFDNQTVYWPGVQPFEYTKITEEFKHSDKSWYAAYEFAAAEHGGTHIDAPYHFSSTGKRVGDLSLDNLIVPLIVADLSSKVNDNPDFVLYKHDLDNMINANMGKPCVLIFKFGWSKYFNDRKKYLGFDEQTKSMRFPGLSVEVAEWITTAHKNIIGIGVDVSSVDPGSSTNFAVHKILSSAGLYNIENVKLEKPIHGYKCTALILPMKLGSGTGAPLRFVAICPKGSSSVFK